MAWVDSVWLNLISFVQLSRSKLAVATARNVHGPPGVGSFFIATKHESTLNITKPKSRSTFRVHARDMSPSAREWDFCPGGGKLQTMGLPMRAGSSVAWSFDCGGARISRLKAAAERRAGRREPPSGDTYPAADAPPRASSTCVLRPLAGSRSLTFRCSRGGCRVTLKTRGQEMPKYYRGDRRYGIMALRLHDMVPGMVVLLIFCCCCCCCTSRSGSN